MKLRITNCELRIDKGDVFPRALAIAVVSAITIFPLNPCKAQQTGAYEYLGEPIYFREDPGLFIEPNRFSATKELQDRSLWLIAGFGRPVIGWNIPNHYGGHDRLSLGLEGLVWSRLRSLSDFRFPVETADYYFGLSVTFNRADDDWRLQIGHISSHFVDGTDSAVIGGSSSHFSREFVDLMTQVSRVDYRLMFTFGVRTYFHQVTKIESWIAIPACLTWRITPDPRKPSLSVFASSGDGPIWPNVTGGLRVETRNNSVWQSSYDSGILDLQLYYQYGASWAGTDAGAKRSTINLQMDVRGF